MHDLGISKIVVLRITETEHRDHLDSMLFLPHPRSPILLFSLEPIVYRSRQHIGSNNVRELIGFIFAEHYKAGELLLV